MKVLQNQTEEEVTPNEAERLQLFITRTRELSGDAVMERRM